MAGMPPTMQFNMRLGHVPKELGKTVKKGLSNVIDRKVGERIAYKVSPEGQSAAHAKKITAGLFNKPSYFNLNQNMSTKQFGKS